MSQLHLCFFFNDSQLLLRVCKIVGHKIKKITVSKFKYLSEKHANSKICSAEIFINLLHRKVHTNKLNIMFSWNCLKDMLHAYGYGTGYRILRNTMVWVH